MYEQIQNRITKQRLAKSWWELQNRWEFNLKSLKLL